MTATVVVQPEAEADLDEAFRWYEARKPGLGTEFLVEIDRVLIRVAEHPELHPEGYRRTRRTVVRRFPYVVLYLYRDETVFILAVLHHRRDPRVFRKRSRDETRRT